jgi:hypothetical protein
VVLILVVVLVVGELLDSAAPTVAAEGPKGEYIERAAREEEESRERDRRRRRPAERARERDEEDAQPAPQAAAHATVGWALLLLRREHGRKRRGVGRGTTPASGKAAAAWCSPASVKIWAESFWSFVSCDPRGMPYWASRMAATVLAVRPGGLGRMVNDFFSREVHTQKNLPPIGNKYWHIRHLFSIEGSTHYGH